VWLAPPGLHLVAVQKSHARMPCSFAAIGILLL
jgi:hypothetical protein